MGEEVVGEEGEDSLPLLGGHGSDRAPGHTAAESFIVELRGGGRRKGDEKEERKADGSKER